MHRKVKRWKSLVLWAGLLVVMVVPVVLAAFSPYLVYRDFPYILGGFAGIVSLSLLFLQPLLAAGYLPGLKLLEARKWHRWLGSAIIVCVAIHIGGLYITSPPDTLDALMLVSPTAFSIYGVLAMWSIVMTAILVIFRNRLGLRYSRWRLIHNALALVIVIATVIHAVQIEGAMEVYSKWALSIAALVSTCVTLFKLRVLEPVKAWGKSG